MILVGGSLDGEQREIIKPKVGQEFEFKVIPLTSITQTPDEIIQGTVLEPYIVEGFLTAKEMILFLKFKDITFPEAITKLIAGYHPKPITRSGRN